MAAAKTRPRVFTKNEPVLGAPLSVSPIVPDPIPPSPAFKDEMPVLGEVNASPAVVAETYTTVSVRLPQTLHDEYVRAAQAQDLSLEELLRHRLDRCRTHNALRGLWFSDSDRSKLEDMIQKRPIESAPQALALLSKGGTFSVEGLDISLTLAQRKVLDLRKQYGLTPKKIFEDMVRREFRV